MAAHTIPSHVSRPSRSWLQHLVVEYQDWTPSEWRLAVLAAEAFDRAQTARRMLGREGLTIVSPRGEVKPHPAGIIARDSATLYSRLVSQLGLDQEPNDDADQSRYTVDALGRRKGKPR